MNSVGTLRLRLVRQQAGDRVGDHHVDAAVLVLQLVGEVGDGVGVGVGDVQDPSPYLGAGAGQLRHLAGRIGHAPLAATGEQDQVVLSHADREPFDEGPAEALIRARDEGDPGSVHACNGRKAPSMSPTKLAHG